MSVKYYRELLVWQKAMDLAVEVHPIALSFPKAEMFALTSQINRSATSVPSNIAEGNGRRTTGEYIHFLGIAKGSLNELETQITLAWRYDYIPDLVHEQLLEKSAEVGRMLNALIEALERRRNS
jgi:four helix bundle protein